MTLRVPLTCFVAAALVGGASLVAEGSSAQARSAAQAAPVTVSITDSALKPAVVVVTLGSEVTWRNDGERPHAIAGPFWASPDLRPGQSHTVRFPRFGEFRYSDRVNRAVTGTVVVVAGGSSGSARPRSFAQRRYRATVSLTVRETSEFYDGKYQSTNGICNAQVGGGLRDVEWTARIPTVIYSRGSRIEILHTRTPAKTRLRVMREQQQSKIASGPPFAARCQDGKTIGEPIAVHDANCTTNLAGKELRIGVGWSAKSGRFSFWNDGPDVGYKSCGPMASLDEELPLYIGVPDEAPYDSGTAIATKRQIDRLRRGLLVRVDQRLDLIFTAECCGFNPRTTPPFGIAARTGVVHRFRARLVITLMPR